MNRLSNYCASFPHGSFRLMIGCTTFDPSATDEQKYINPIDPNSNRYLAELAGLMYLDFVPRYSAISLSPPISFWNRFGWVTFPDHNTGNNVKQPFAVLMSEFTDKEVEEFMLQCMTRISRFPAPEVKADPKPSTDPRYPHPIKDIKGMRLS